MIIYKSTNWGEYCVFFRSASQAIREAKREMARSVRSAKAEHRIYDNKPEIDPVMVYRIEFSLDKDSVIDLMNSTNPLIDESQLIKVITPRASK